MRFWRRNVPAAPSPETEEAAAPAAAEETALQTPEPEVEAREPSARKSDGDTTTSPPEREGGSGWLWRRDILVEPPPETEEPPAAQVEETALRPPQPAPEVEEAGPSPVPPESVGPLPRERPAERQGWFWRRDIPVQPAAEAEEPPAEAEAEIEIPQPLEAEPEIAEVEPLRTAPAAPPTTVPEGEAAERRGWFNRLRAGLSRSSARLNDGINAIFNRRRLDDAALEELEELLISSDMGIGVAGEVTESLRRTRFNQEVSPEEVRTALAEQVIRLIEPVTRPLRIDHTRKPFVILVIGVNGSGKTTTIAKLAKQYRDQGLNVVLAAGDTFRAAAVEQLQIWGERTGCAVVTRPAGSDAAGLAYDALVQAQNEGADVLLIDTAGRLHNKADLMGELQKIVRVVKKVDAAAPHSVLLVLDATTGQNAHAQAEIFRDMVGVTGIVMTKLDGTARGGVLVSLAEKYGIPIHAIGVGESADDLRPFEATAYARSLVGLES
jgi:fused signal recognition particle receptor